MSEQRARRGPSPTSEPVTEALAVEVALHSQRRSTEDEAPAKSLRERIKALASDDRNRFLSSYQEGRYDAISDALEIIDAARAVPMDAERIAALRQMLDDQMDSSANFAMGGGIVPEKWLRHERVLRGILRDAGAETP